MSDEPSSVTNTSSAAHESQPEKSTQQEKPKPKDRWDKLDILGKLVSGVLIASAGIVVGIEVNQASDSSKNAIATMETASRQEIATMEGNHEKTLEALQARNTASERASAIERLVQHLTPNDPGKNIAEKLMVDLEEPEKVLEFALVDGDRRILCELSNSPKIKNNPDILKKYRDAIDQLNKEVVIDNYRFGGIWVDHSKNQPEFKWAFEVTEPRQLLITRVDGPDLQGEGDFRKVGDHWEGVLYVDSIDYDRFKLIPEGQGRCKTGREKCARLQGTRGFEFTRVK